MTAIKNILKSSLPFLLILAAIAIICQDNSILLFKRISLVDLLVAIVISFLLYAVTGYAMGFLISKQYQIKMNPLDILTLPLMMTFWGLVVPIRGGLLYAAFFLKSKYKLKAVEGLSVPIYIQMLSFVLMGAVGIIYLVAQNRLFSFPTLVVSCLLFSPLILKLANAVFQKLPLTQWEFLKKIKTLINSVVIHSSLPWSDMKTNSLVGLLLLSRFFLRAIRYYWATLVFGIEVSFWALVILTFAIETADIMLRTPGGNLGLNELISGGIVNILGEETQEGILIALFSRLSNLLLIFTAGLWAVIVNMRHFQIDNFKSLWAKIKTS